MILHFAKTVPPKIPANLGIGITRQLGGASQAEVDCTYFDALQSLSSSPYILFDTSTFDSPNDSVEVQEIYSKILRDISLERVRGKSVQVTGRAGTGRSALVKLIAQKIRQESSVVVIDGFTTLSDKRPGSLYRIFVSFIHQIISQRPSLFRPIQNLMAEILRQEAWT